MLSAVEALMHEHLHQCCVHALDLTNRQLTLLLICYSDKTAGAKVRHLASKMNVPKSSITRASQTLESLGLLARTPSSRTNLRDTNISITHEGRIFAERYAAGIQAALLGVSINA